MGTSPLFSLLKKVKRLLIFSANENPERQVKKIKKILQKIVYKSILCLYNIQQLRVAHSWRKNNIYDIKQMEKQLCQNGNCVRDVN